METTIKHNDAFIFLAKAMNLPETKLVKVIYKNMLEEGVMYNDNTIAGFSIKSIFEENAYSEEQMFNVLFPESKPNQEALQVLSDIIFWGSGCEHPCPECGCECDVEVDGVGSEIWNEYDCQNSECDYKSSDEPDWEILPGGRKHF